MAKITPPPAKSDEAKRKKSWIVFGSDYMPARCEAQVDRLPNAVFEMKKDQFGAGYLSRVSGNFFFPFKVYGIEQELIDHVIKTYKATTGNLGVLLNGTKGAGKTVTAKSLCNTLGLPVVVITEDFPDLIRSMSEIDQDVVFLFDEFEKSFPLKGGNGTTTISGFDEDGDPVREKPGATTSAGSRLLTMMDGVYNTKNRRVFILTTNNLTVEPNLLQRPSRIRYLKTFGNLTPKVVDEVVNDLLDPKLFHLRVPLIRFIAQLELVTIDIVKAVVQEVNIHQVEPEVFGDIFNVHKVQLTYDVYRLERYKGDKAAKFHPFRLNARVDPKGMVDDLMDPASLNDVDRWLGTHLMVNARDLGEIKKIDKKTATLTTKRYTGERRKDGGYETVTYSLQTVETYNNEFKLMVGK